ncbi:LTA synthase family protein [Wenzhouxiangella sediminis]|uniref:LTA synthase family protein n=1 Tax=Wenzhouxiangella sediminis TaxID=1792836 RepID=UPI0011C0360E|nr:sulfatase-like hydrolase/transferase [Wenzhouxiangella sediminis]
MPRAKSQLVAVTWPWVAIAAILALFVLRARVVEDHYGAVVACEGCFFLPSIVQDLWVLAIACVLLAMVIVSPWRLLRWLGGLVLSVLLIGYVIDVYLLHAFGIRLFLADIAVYGLSIGLVVEQFAAWAGGVVPAVLLIVLLVGLVSLPAVLPRSASPVMMASLVLVGLVSTGVAAFGPAPDFVNSWIYRNFLQANSATTESVRYSPERIEAIRNKQDAILPRSCESSPVDRRNVIVLILESWSSYQSPAFGGHLDWTPELDALAMENVRYTNLHAGGFSTNEGLVNILGGVRLWAPFEHLFEAAEFGHAWGIDGGMAEVLGSAGFRTAFLTTGPLSFLRKGEWLRDLGFDYVEGNQHPFYEDWERVAFHAAADEALYRRALQWTGDQADSPYLLVLETVSTHQPYINPETGAYDIEGSFRYADRWAAWFHDRLEERGFFDSGVLLVVSDHRSMTPISAEEQERFGRGAASRIPMFMVDKQWQGAPVVDRVHGLGDLVAGMRQRVSGEVCTDATQASPFRTDEAEGSCAFHLRGSQRGIVDVFCGDGNGRVLLDGDDTRFTDVSGLSPRRREQVLTAIALERIRGSERARRYEAAGGDR